MSTAITLKYCGMEASGRTVKEAKQEAARRIEHLLTVGYWTPTILWSDSREYGALVWREVDGWHYRTFQRDRLDDPNRGRMYGGSAEDDEEGAIHSAKKHLAGLEPILPDDPFRFPSYLADKRDRADFIRKIAWQLAYRAAAAQGMKDTEAHEWAWKNRDEFGKDVQP